MEPNWELLLKIWAVVGPLIAGGASAIWSRRNQIQDRDHAMSRESEQRAHLLSEQESEHKRKLSAETYQELKAALTNFMTSSNNFVSRQCEWLTDPTPETKAASLLAIENFNHHCQLVVLLAKAETADLATEVWNTAFTIPKSYKTLSDTEHQEKLEKYKLAKSKFIIKAREELASSIAA